MQSDLERELEREIWSNRMLVFLETDEGFSQVLFTPEHFCKVSEAIAKGFPLLSKEGTQEVLDLKISEDTLPKEPFEGLRDWYEEDSD